MFGGYGSDYRVFSKMLRALAQGCGSSAWVAAVHGEHNWVIGNYPEEAQREVWGSNPHAVASASVAPNGTAETVSGGYRLSGRWGFASGIDHAQWILLGGMVKGDRQARAVDVPSADRATSRSSTTGTSWASAAPAASRWWSRTSSCPRRAP